MTYSVKLVFVSNKKYALKYVCSDGMCSEISSGRAFSDFSFIYMMSKLHVICYAVLVLCCILLKGWRPCYASTWLLARHVQFILVRGTQECSPEELPAAAEATAAHLVTPWRDALEVGEPVADAEASEWCATTLTRWRLGSHRSAPSRMSYFSLDDWWLVL